MVPEAPLGPQPHDYLPAVQENDSILLVPQPLRNPIVSREEWGAKPPLKPFQKREGLVRRVICSHTSSNICETEDSCVKAIQDLQDSFMREKGVIDLPYK